MSWVSPNSVVKILKNVPLDDRYENTVFWATANAQSTTLATYAKYTFNTAPATLTYQRQNKNSIRINKKADDLYDCNYMMFQNTSYGSKWFYAFIKEVNYINDNVSEVVYSIDDLQTWNFDYVLEKCFVEREHADSDGIGDNLIPENLPTGEICYAGKDDIIYWNYQTSGGSISGTTNNDDLKPCIVIVCPFDFVGDNKKGSIAGGLYTGLNYIILYSDPSSETNDLTLEEKLTIFFEQARVQARAEEIVTMFYYFKGFAQGTSGQTSYTIGESGGSITVKVGNPNNGYRQISTQFNKDFRGFKNDYSKTDGVEPYYVPKNNKLFTAPYNYISVTDWNGNSIDYGYEYFNSATQCSFMLQGTVSTLPCIAITPVGYLGSSTHTDSTHVALDPNYDYTFWYKDFPKVPWNTDGFIAWLAQTGVALAGSAVGTAMQLGVGGIQAFALNEANGVYNSMIDTGVKSRILSHSFKSTQAQQTYNNTLSSMAKNMYAPTDYGALDMQQLPNYQGAIRGILASGAVAALKGTRVQGQSSPSASWGINNIRVSAVHKKIRKEYAQIIDDYFTMFGYQTNKVKIPNRNVRTNFTYTKTVGCAVYGSLPEDAASNIAKIYDNGIRFWKDITKVGDYSVTNSVLTNS